MPPRGGQSRATQAIRARRKRIVRPKGGLGGAITAGARAIWGMGSAGAMAPIRGKGAKNGRPMRPGLRGWDIGTTPSIGRKRPLVAGSASRVIPGPRAPQRLAEGGGLSDWRKVVPVLKPSRAEELRVAAKVVHGLREEIASSITRSLQTSAKPVLPHE
jgi:hypothetical protein